MMNDGGSFTDLRQNFAARPLFGGELGRDLDEMQRRSHTGAGYSVGRSHDQQQQQPHQSPASASYNATVNLPQYPHTPGQTASGATRGAPLVEHHHLGAGGTPAGGGGYDPSMDGGHSPSVTFQQQNQQHQQQSPPRGGNASASNIRGPSQSGAWSLLPPQIPRPLGLQRFIDQQFAPPPEFQGMPPPGSGGVNSSPDRHHQPVSSTPARSGNATRGTKSTPMSGGRRDTPTKGGRQRARAAGGGGARRAPNPAAAAAYGNATTDDEADADPIANAAWRRREEAAIEAMLHTGGPGVSEFAQSVGVGQAEAVAAKMAAEVAKQAAQRPVTSEDLQSNSSMNTSRAPTSLRPTEVQLMKKRIERIDDGLARAQMRQQLAQERLKNVVASGLVTDEGMQTDPSFAPIDTGAKRRALVDPSALDANSMGGTMGGGGANAAGGGGAGSGGGGAFADEAQQEAVRKMNAMRGAGLLLMPAVPYEHFKYVPPDLSAHLRGATEKEEKKPGQAMSENKNLLKDRLDQLQLANEELLVRSRVVPTQADQAGSARVAAETPSAQDPTSVFAPVDPREQMHMSPQGRAPQPDVQASVVDHTAAAYRMQHQNVAAPAGGYGSVTDPASQREAQRNAEEEHRWGMAKARNEAEGVTLTARNDGPMGASALTQMRSNQDDTGIMTNAALRTLPQGAMRNTYDARKKWDQVSFEVPGSRFGGTAMGEITGEAQKLYGFDGANGGGHE